MEKEGGGGTRNADVIVFLKFCYLIDSFFVAFACTNAAIFWFVAITY